MPQLSTLERYCRSGRPERHEDWQNATREAIRPSMAAAKRPFTVADAIRMTRIAGVGARSRFGGELTSNFATFSPDRKRFVMIVKRGDLRRNTNEYSLLGYTVAKILDAPHPRILVTFSSSSNRAAINEPQWLSDNNTVLFVGEQSGQTTQLYAVSFNSGRIRRLTNHPTNLLAYSASGDGRRIAYIAEDPTRKVVDEHILRTGLHVSGESVFDLIEGRYIAAHTQLFVTRSTDGATRPLQAPGRFEGAPIFLSPDGRYLVVSQNVSHVPSAWRAYQDKNLRRIFHLHIPKGSPSYIPRYEIVDIQTGQIRVLLNAPANYSFSSDVAWMPDSHSVLLTGVHLPLNGSGLPNKQAREKKTFVVEVAVRDLKQKVVVDRDLKFIHWQVSGRVLELADRSQNGNAAKVHYFRRAGDRWIEEPPKQTTSQGVPDILCEQSLNSPPKVVARDRNTGRTVSLLDLNPQFRYLSFGKVESITWKDGYGDEIHGDLYLPPSYMPGRRYPLVIQTHGVTDNAFWVDGPFSTANAAQPLANQGIVVLQAPDLPDLTVSGTPDEAPRMMDIYERAVDYLSRKGIVDPKRVGLIGFSHTCWYVEYTLTHSKYRFAAAVVADGIDGGYFQYVLATNANPLLQFYEEGINGASPFGKGLSLWRKRSPEFLLEKVQTPIQIQAITPFSVLTQWGSFSGLSRLNKPVDMVYIPTGYHILQKPWDRQVSQQGAVDWFCFWLNGEILNPANTALYTHLRRLRDMMLDSDGQRRVPLRRASH